MQFNNPYMTTTEKLDTIARWIIINSILYYELDSPIVSDEKFDANAKQLVEIIQMNPEASEAMRWKYVFEDFDGSTGFHLYSRMKRADKNRMMWEAKWVKQWVDQMKEKGIRL